MLKHLLTSIVFALAYLSIYLSIYWSIQLCSAARRVRQGQGEPWRPLAGTVLLPGAVRGHLQNVINMKYDHKFKVEIDDLSEFLKSENRLLLKEDMLQLICENYIIDVGFYNTEFILYIIKDYNWDKPYFKKNINDKCMLTKEINKACSEVLSLIENK